MAQFSSTNQPAIKGRKKRPQNYVAMAETRIRDRLPEIIDSLFDAGFGVWARDEDGERKIYQRPPDTRALIHLMDRAIGKVPERIEGDFDHSFTINLLYAAIASRDSRRISDTERAVP